MYVYQLTKQKHAWMHRIRRLGQFFPTLGFGTKGLWCLGSFRYTMAWELGGVEVMFSTQWRFLHFVVFFLV